MSNCRPQHLNLQSREMTFTVRALVFCYLLGVHVSGDEVNINGSVKNTAKADDVSLPKIHIVVRTYSKAEVVRDDAQEEDGELGEISNDLPNVIKSQNSDGILNDGASKLSSSFSDSQESVKFNEPENKVDPNTASFISKSLERISGMATLAWDYVTHAEEQTQRPDPGNYPPRSGVMSEVHQSFETGIIDDGTGADDVYFEDENLKNTELNQENLPNSEIPNGKIIVDKVSNEIISSDDKKLDLPTHTIKDKPGKNIRKEKTENSKFKQFSYSHSRNNVKDSKVWKLPKQQIYISRKNTSSSNSQSDESDNETDAGRKGSSNETPDVDDSRLLQADQSSFFDFFLGGSETKTTPANKQLDTGPEDAEDDDMDNASPVSGYDGDIQIVERPLVNGIDYPGYNSRRPVAETDLRSGAVSHLIDHYDRCNTCMVQNTSHRCHYYNDQADEFDKWAKYYTDLLRYGCSNTDEVGKQRCCHRPQTIAQTTLQEINLLVKSIYHVLRNQCDKCPVDCSWTEWQSWNNCPINCGSGISTTRNRTRTRRVEKYGGRHCQGDDLQQDGCPVERCDWQSWSPWSPCSSTCGGTRHRSRKPTQPTTYSCFVPCEGTNIDVESCDNNPECCHSRQWGDWSHWTDCDVATDTRVRHHRRWRSCEADPHYKDQPMCPDPCPGEELEKKDCCIPASWGAWSSWTEREAVDGRVDEETREPCGKGCSNRTRVCNKGDCPGGSCFGKEIERMFFNLTPCCEPPVWSQWCPWAECSVTCGRGTRRRSRDCQADPTKWRSPICKAKGCYGQPDKFEVEDCGRNCHCEVQPSWGGWGQWSQCDFFRGNPRRTRTRHCIKNSDPACQHLPCPGDGEMEERCECQRPIWEAWSPWGACNRNGNSPTRQRHRQCRRFNNPAYCPKEDCVGDVVERERCCGRQEWGSWQEWSQCDHRSNPPVSTRIRYCNRPDPGCPDQSCPGLDREMKECKLPPCERPIWEHWSPWGPCNRNANPPTRQRNRECRKFNNPAYCPREDCVGDAVERERCCGRQEWGSWQEWSQCDRRSNPPVNTRIRYCNRPDPGCPNESCPGLGRETKECEHSDCDPGQWNNWSSWTDCNCNTKTKSRTRTKQSQIADLQLCPPFSDTQHQKCEPPDHPNCPCHNREDGEYPSNIPGCRHYITCCQGEARTVECKGDQQYDSLCKTCVKTPSPTCPDGQFDLHRNEMKIKGKKPEECPH